MKPKSPAARWDEHFAWDLPRQAGALVVTVMDKDQITRDDLIGVVRVPLEDIPLDQAPPRPRICKAAAGAGAGMAHWFGRIR